MSDSAGRDCEAVFSEPSAAPLDPVCGTQAAHDTALRPNRVRL